MPVHKGSDCVGEEMGRFSKGQMHSGKGGKVVSSSKQAKAIALSACGQSKYSEVLQSMGFPASVSDEVTAMFAEIDWSKQFENGKGPGPENKQNYETGTPRKPGRGQLPVSKTGVKGDLGKQKVNNDSEMLSPVVYPKQRADWNNPPSKQLNGMQMLG
jgi:hypothetical protein